MDVEVPEELMDAWKFCIENTAGIIDDTRGDFLQVSKELQLEVADERAQWLAEEVASPHRRLLSGINVPLIKRLQVMFDIPDCWLNI